MSRRCPSVGKRGGRRGVLGGVELVGRDVELAALRRAFEDVRGGGGRVVGVLGEAGIGKTELVGALAGYARDAGLLVLEAAAPNMSAPCPSRS